MLLNSLDDPAAILEQVRDSLAAWEIAPVDISLASQSENIVYLVVAGDGTKFALRIHRPGYHSLAELNAEHEWTAALDQAGFIVPTARPTRDGDFYLPVEVNGAPRFVGVIEWLAGETLYDWERREPTTAALCDQLSALGELMARMHNFTSTWQPSAGFVRNHWDVAGFFGDAPHWGRYWDAPVLTDLQRETLLASQPVIIDRLNALGTGSEVFGMIHADLHHGNVFLQENGAMAIIDFDDAGFGWYLYDIAVALQSYQQHPSFDELVAAIVAGYRRAREFTEYETSLIPMFLHIRSRATIGWATARPELDNAERLRKLANYTAEEAAGYLE